MANATQHYGLDWRHSRLASGSFSYDAAQCILLQEIRDELKKLNRLLGCSNFTSIPAILRAIRRNTTKATPKRKRLRRVA